MRKLFKIIIKYYEDSAYCCPKCGTHQNECNTTDWYSFICSKCGTEFETPDT